MGVYVDFFYKLNLLPPYSLRLQGDKIKCGYIFAVKKASRFVGKISEEVTKYSHYFEVTKIVMGTVKKSE